MIDRMGTNDRSCESVVQNLTRHRTETDTSCPRRIRLGDLILSEKSHTELERI